MSVIVALKKYGFLFENNEEKSFFARCIVGYPYTLKTEEKYSFLNCMISLLNSTVIDVDKLDYLIRDAYITGFETISIDYERLLTSIRLRKTENGYKLVYLKGAISVIENVVYAHDAERKWIQNHPAVQYEDYLLQIAIESIRLKYAGKNIFSLAALTEEGIKLSEEYKIKFLCDADILFLMKNLENDVAVREYLQRKDRRHPLWKSESEYKAVFRGDAISGINHIVEKALDDLCAYLNYVNKSQVINQEALEACERDITAFQKLMVRDEKNKSKYETVRRHIVGGANRTLISVKTPSRSCRIGT